MSGPVAKDQHDLVIDIDRHRSKHRTRERGSRGERIQHEFVRRRPVTLPAQNLRPGFELARCQDALPS
jgi:hypothetical protein